jgi:hypothetical protein
VQALETAVLDGAVHEKPSGVETMDDARHPEGSRVERVQEEEEDWIMFRKLTAVLGFAALIGAGTTYAGSSQPQPGEWSRETRQIGNKVTIDVFQRAPYALTGNLPETGASKPSHGWTHEARQVGNKVTIEAFSR